MASKDRTNWQEAPLLFVQRPSCPHCGGLEYDRQKTNDGGDGSFTRLVFCRTCTKPYRICYEIPKTGNSETVVW